MKEEGRGEYSEESQWITMTPVETFMIGQGGYIWFMIEKAREKDPTGTMKLLYSSVSCSTDQGPVAVSHR